MVMVTGTCSITGAVSCTAFLLLWYLFLAVSYIIIYISINYYIYCVNATIYSATFTGSVSSGWGELSVTCGAVSGFRLLSSVVIVSAHIFKLLSEVGMSILLS